MNLALPSFCSHLRANLIEDRFSDHLKGNSLDNSSAVTITNDPRVEGTGILKGSVNCYQFHALYSLLVIKRARGDFLVMPYSPSNGSYVETKPAVQGPFVNDKIYQVVLSISTHSPIRWLDMIF